MIVLWDASAAELLRFLPDWVQHICSLFSIWVKDLPIKILDWLVFGVLAAFVVNFFVEREARKVRNYYLRGLIKEHSAFQKTTKSILDSLSAQNGNDFEIQRSILKLQIGTVYDQYHLQTLPYLRNRDSIDVLNNYFALSKQILSIFTFNLGAERMSADGTLIYSQMNQLRTRLHEAYHTDLEGVFEQHSLFLASLLKQSGFFLCLSNKTGRSKAIALDVSANALLAKLNTAKLQSEGKVVSATTSQSVEPNEELGPEKIANSFDYSYYLSKRAFRD